MEFNTEISSELAKIVDLAGTNEFYPHMCRLLSRFVGWDARMIMQYSKAAKPRYLWTENVPNSDINLYLTRFYRLDPFFAYWRSNDGAEVLRMSDTATQETKTTAYFRLFQPMIGSKDALGVFLPIHGSSAIVICFECAEVLPDQAMEPLKSLLPLLVSLNKSHQRTLVRRLIDKTGDSDPAQGAMAVYSSNGDLLRANKEWELSTITYPEISQAIVNFEQEDEADQMILEGGVLKRTPLSDLITFGPDAYLLAFEPGTAFPPVDLNSLSSEFLENELTPRERDIVMRIVQGASSLDIAFDLNLSEGTVKNHRKRIYKKLSIYSERELLALYIRHISQHL